MATNYARLAKYGFLFGVSLFLAGIGGELLGAALSAPLPDWLGTVLVSAEAIGILVGLVTPLLFGIVLPLIE